jgi:hypothetical protein
MAIMSFLANSAVASQSRLIAAEDFDYDQATLTAGLNGGFGWAETWTGESFVTVGSLGFTGFGTHGHKLTTNPSPGREAIKCSYRLFSTNSNDELMENGKFGRDDTTLWLGFLVNAPTGLSTGYGGLSLYDDDRQQIFIGDTGASDVYAIERTGQLQRFTDIRTDGAIHFVVCRLAFAVGDEKVDMWIDPLPGNAQPSDTSIAASATVRDFRFNRVRFCSAPVPMNFDALRLGTKFSDLIPPMTAQPISMRQTTGIWIRLLIIAVVMALLGILILGTLFWALARRRRREPPLV